MSAVSIHLCLLAGADNRHAYLRDTVRISQEFFEAIHLIDTGSTDETESLRHADRVRYRRLEDWRDDWPLAYSESLREIPHGDWFLFLDSDERPSPPLLDHLQEDVQRFDAAGVNCGHLPGMLHLSGRPVPAQSQELASVLQVWPATHEDFLRHPCWTKRNLIKRLPTTYLAANGAHCGFCQAPERSRYLPRFYNHYKSAREIAASTVLCSWHCLEAYGVPQESPEWQRHRTLRELTGLGSASEFLRVAQAGDLPPVWLEFWQTLEHSSLPTLVEYWKFAFRFGFSTQPEASYCGHACCRYRGEQL